MSLVDCGEVEFARLEVVLVAVLVAETVGDTAMAESVCALASRVLRNRVLKMLKLVKNA